MPSIRKTKKRLKREIAELYEDWNNSTLTGLERCFLGDAIHHHVTLLKQDLQQLKRKGKLC